MSTTEKYSPEQLRSMAQYVLRQRDAGNPKYELLIFMLMMRLGTFDRHVIEQRIEEYAQ